MQTVKGAQVSRRAAFAVLLLGFFLSACASSSLSVLGLGSPEKTPATTAQAKPAVLAPADPLADVETTIRQAQSLRQAGDFQGAARVLSQLVLFVPDNPRLLGEYGKVLAAEGRSDDALAFLERAIQLQPNEWSFYSAQGVAYDAQGKYKPAQESYARALVLKPGDPTVLNNAALSHMQAGDLDGAEQLLLQAGMAPEEFPRIAQNLTLVRSLKAARVEAAPVPTTPALAAVPAAVVAAPIAAPQRAPDPLPVVARTEPPHPVEIAPPVRTAPLPVARVAPPERKSLPARSVAATKPVFASKPALAASLALAGHAQAPSAKTAYYVQAGAYGTQERAGRIAHDLDSLGARVSPATIGGHPIYRVRIGPFRDADQAGTAIDLAKQMGHADVKIVLE